MDNKQIMRDAFYDGRIMSDIEPDEKNYTYVYAYRLGQKYARGEITIQQINDKLRVFLKGL